MKSEQNIRLALIEAPIRAAKQAARFVKIENDLKIKKALEEEELKKIIVPNGFHKMPDGSIMLDSDMEKPITSPDIIPVIVTSSLILPLVAVGLFLYSRRDTN